MATELPAGNAYLHQLPRLDRAHLVDVVTHGSEMDLQVQPGYCLTMPDQIDPVASSSTPKVHEGPSAAEAAMGAI